MMAPNVINQQLRLFGGEFERDPRLQEVVGRGRQFRPHRDGSHRRVAVVIAIRPHVPQGGGALAVFGDAEVHPPQAPRRLRPPQ